MFIIYFFPLLAFLFLSLFLFTGIWKRTPWGRKLFKPVTRTPLKGNLLSGPGETLRNQVSDLQMDTAFDIAMLFLVPLLVLAIVFASPIEQRTILNLIVGIVFIGIHIIRIGRKFKEMQIKRLGLDGEIATAQALDTLKQLGYYIYHDFPADGFNIDHVVIGSSGVYSIETKTRSKPNENGTDSANVYMTGNELKFPKYKDAESIKQALEQAKWLSEFLRKSVGKPIFVKPVLALPGWFVNRSSSSFDKLIVINPKEAIVIAKEKQILDEQTIEQIKFQVEQQCRTVKPFYPI